MKINKMIKSKVFWWGVLAVLLISISGTTSFDRASADSVRKVKIIVTSNGKPVYNTFYSGKSLQPAYEKIKTGSITDEDMNTIVWKNLSDNNIDISKVFKIGPGMTHSASETLEILRQLANAGGNGVALINYFNQDTPGTIFHWPGNASRRYTDNSGEAEATLPMGVVAISDINGAILKIVEVTSETETINLDKVNTSEEISGEIVDLPRKARNTPRQYVVEYGQEVTYKLTIKKEFISANTSISIMPQSNLVIDDISVPYSKKSIFPAAATPQSFGVVPNLGLSNDLMLSQLKSDIQRNLYNGIIESYSLEVPQRDSDFSFEIKAHIDPAIQFSRTVYDISTNVPETQVDMTIGGENIQPNADYFMNVTANNGEKLLNYSMPVIRSTGANFVTVKSGSKELVSDYSYFLGYKDNGKNYIYSNTGWQEAPENLSTLDSSSYRVFSGGKIYYLGSGFSMDIPLNTSSFSFNAEQSLKANQSLIKFYGLGQGRDYFLYTARVPENSASPRSETHFEAFSKDKLTPSGSAYTYSTTRFAKNQDFNINNKIPDYGAGVQEYQAISVDGSSRASAKMRILLFVGGTVVFIVIGAFILIRREVSDDK
ncbi:hypothetical protein F4V47_00640 [Lactococcus garvieae subsp. garvieae]|uniref:hypothetical protein n=2 Tax=Lactococcus garvieae TaxID=1363 RepID=UPI0005AAAA66|nr:hypothetical protein [Lactococcus garvieae]KAA8719132.1 hypothetical protein F4V47_00640 [Lactococcus garvieae subsp. garvieae]MDG6190834.1 hypothetical protein [Lactococcus garvieae]QPR49134.1 hypothetical protein I6G86_01180 [Lactococcus garvieae]